MAKNKDLNEVTEDKEDSFQNTMDELESLKDSMESMMDTQIKTIDTQAKKMAVHSVLWTIAAIIVYFIWPEKWYFWIPAVFAALSIGTFVFISVLRNKLKKKMAK